MPTMHKLFTNACNEAHELLGRYRQRRAYVVLSNPHDIVPRYEALISSEMNTEIRKNIKAVITAK